MLTDDLRDELNDELDEALPELELFMDYHAGRHRLQYATSKFKEAFGELFGAFATNWCGLVVDVAVERLEVQGFRFGEETASAEAWRMWQENKLDARSVIAHTEAIKCGWAYLLVSPPAQRGGQPRITVEHPMQCWIKMDPADPSRRLAGMKRYIDADGTHICVVYEPNKITTYRREMPGEADMVMGIPVITGHGMGWDTIDVQPNPLGEVLLVPLQNNPTLMSGGISDLAPAVALNDAANKFFTDMIHASEFTSFPQRVLTGVELPRDPITGEIANESQIRAAVSRLWAFEDPETKVFDLQSASLTNYVEGIDLAVQHMAAQTRTPPQYLLAKLANLSAEALTAAESGLIARVERKQRDFGEAWEEAMRLAFAWRAIDRAGWAGADEDVMRAQMTDAETIWTSPESRNPSVAMDALVKKQQIAVPNRMLWEEAGYTPQQIERMKELLKEEQEAAAEAAGQAPDAAGLATVAQAGDSLAVGGLAAQATEAP